jgi:hypothetical protein
MLRVPHERIDNTILEIIRFRDKNQDLILDSYALAGKLNVQQDRIRNSFSRLRKRMIPISPMRKKGQKGLYILVEENNPKHHEYLEHSVNYNIKQIKTMYFNNVVKYLPIIKDEKTRKLVGELDLVFKGESNV